MLRLLPVLALMTASAAPTAQAATFPTLSGAPPVVWAHRGASWESRENTLEAAELAHRQGADGFELDLVLTADGRLAVIHDATLNRLTDIETRPEFAARGKPNDDPEGPPVLWHVRDFTMAELKTLEIDYARSPLDVVREPALNPYAVADDTVFRIPEYREALDVLSGKPHFEVLTEVKIVDGTPEESDGILDALFADWADRGYEGRDAPVVLQSFSAPFMQAAKARLDATGSDLRTVQLLDPFTFPLSVPEIIPSQEALSGFLAQQFGNLDGIAAFYGSYLIAEAPFADVLNPSGFDLVAAAHAAGLDALGYTFAFPIGDDPAAYILGEYVPWLFDPALGIDPGAQYHDALALGLDGIITDTPLLALEARSQFAATIPTPASGLLAAGALAALSRLRRRG